MSQRLDVDERFITADEDEREELAGLEALFDQSEASPQLIQNGQPVNLPESVVKVLRRVVPLLAEGDAVAIAPIQAELTTQQAADILNVSRPYLIKLLDRDEIPHTLTGSHRRIKLADLLEYKRCRDRQRREALAELTRMSRELGLYDDK